MTRIIVSSDTYDITEFLNFANVATPDFHFAPLATVDSLKAFALLHVSDHPNDAPYLLDPFGLRVGAAQLPEIARYANLAPPEYLLLCTLMGLTQWRTLRQNPLLQPEDLPHQPYPNCLFGEVSHPSDFLHRIESLAVCPGCTGFYNALGVERELLALRAFLDGLATSRGLLPETP